MALTGNRNFKKLPLSGGTGNGRRIKVSQTATPGTTIHTGPTDAAQTDEVWIEAHNYDTVARTLTIEWGGNTAPDDTVAIDIPAKGSVQVPCSGGVLAGAASPLVIKAFASAANVVTLGGYANRME